MRKLKTILCLLCCMALVLPALALADGTTRSAGTKTFKVVSEKFQDLKARLIVRDGNDYPYYEEILIPSSGTYTVTLDCGTNIPQTIFANLYMNHTYDTNSTEGLEGRSIRIESIKLDGKSISPVRKGFSVHYHGTPATVRMLLWNASGTMQQGTYTSWDGDLTGANDAPILTGSVLQNYQKIQVTFTYGLFRETEETEEPIKKTSTKYYALCIGELSFISYSSTSGYYWDKTERNVGDAKNMAKMLKKVKGPGGNKYKVTVKQDLSYDKIESAIRSTFKKATKNDVCLFFIATHGNSSGDGELAMPYLGKSQKVKDYLKFAKSKKASLPFNVLAGWLKKYCKGKVIVILESCGAGSSIYKKGVEQNLLGEIKQPDEVELTSELSTPKKGAVANGKLIDNSFEATQNGFDSDAFVSKAISVFAQEDPGFLESNKGAGAMRKSKFYVLAAARHHEMSWGSEYHDVKKSENYFTKWLIEGVGSKSYAPADTDSNKVLTLNELFNYLKGYNDYKFYSQGYVYYQHAQVYPKNSSYALFSWR